MALEKNYSEDYKKHIEKGHSLKTIIAAYRREGLKIAIISMLFLIPCILYFVFVCTSGTVSKQGWAYEHPLLNYLLFVICLLVSFFTFISFIGGLLLFFFPKGRVLKDKKDYDDCVSGKKPWYKPSPVNVSLSSSSSQSPPHKIQKKCKVCGFYLWVEYGIGICPACGFPNDYRYD